MGSQDGEPAVLVAGRYRVHRVAGDGARKRVLLATDTWLERPVAVCLSRRSGRQELERLRQEAARTARVGGSERIVGVYDVGEADGVPYLTTEYVPGGSLQDLLAAGPVPVPRALAIGVDVALALADVHAQGLVHRDVKPGNVWLTAQGHAVLGDFGLAVDVGETGHEHDLLTGTAGYLPPEQIAGHPPAPAGDLYALGVVLYELLCGRGPFTAPDLPTLLAKHTTAVPEPPSQHRPDVPPALDALVLRLLAKTPAARPGSAAAVAAELAALQDAALAASPATSGATGFVGRTSELGELRGHVAAAAQGRGGLALLLGEAGMGKTRLAGELAAHAAADGVLVLEGRCHDAEGAPAYWPWTQVLRAAHDRLGDAELRRLAGPSLGLLTALLPELGTPEPGALESEGARVRLFDAVSRVLHAAAAARPVLVLVDDVHWADVATLALTRYVAREATGRRVAVVACARELPAPDEPAAAALRRLAEVATRTLVLGGLPLEQSTRVVEQLAGVRPTDELMQTLHGQTEGNPFFLTELVHLLAAEGRITEQGTLVPGPAVVPRGVLDVVHRRLQHVPPACVRVLRTAAVVGRDVPFDVLERVTGLGPRSLLARLDEAVAARLLVAVPGLPVTHRFPHALVQEALYAALPAVERVELHRAVAEALTELRGTLEEHAAELAHHFLEALPGGDPVPAIRWSVRAAQQALTATAHEEAVAHYERAVAVAQPLPPQPGAPGLGALLLALGDAQCRAGLTDAGRATFQRAADLAISDDDAELLARAALGYGVGLGGFGFVEHADGILLSLLEEALAALDDGDSELRMRVLARLATELYFTPFRSRRLQASDEALAMARRLGDPAGELVALYSRTWALLGPDGLAERRTTADRAVRLAQALGDDEMAFRAHHLRLNVRLESGEWEQVATDLDSCRRLSATLAQPVHRWQAAVFDAMQALLTADPEEGARRADEALAHGRRGYTDMAMVVYGAQLMTARWAQGRLEELVEAVRSYADRYPHAPAWRAALAFCYTEVGRPEAARAELASLAGRAFTDLPRDGNFLTAATLLAHVAARVGDLPRARLLRAHLSPYADRDVVIAAGAVAFTSVHLALAALSTALGDPDTALDHVERARARHAARGARTYLVWTAEEHVRALLARSGAADRAAAAVVAREALTAAAELGMRRHAERLLAAVPEAALDPTSPAQPVTVLLTDVAGSAALTERLGELAMHELLAGHRRQAEQLARENGGVALKSLGDGVLLAFPDAAPALRCAAQLQHQAAAAGLALRLAVHTGTVLREGDSMYGRTMIVAFRVADRARAGEVLVSGETRDAVRGEPGLRFERGRRLRLKGISDLQRVHRLLWDQRTGA